MKWLLLAVIFIYSCGGNFSASLSVDQKGLYSLSNDFRSEYKEARDNIAREKLMDNYTLKLQRYLTHTCDSTLKNIKVRMVKFEEDAGGSVLAEFADKNCRYVFRQVYDSSYQMKKDVVYNLVKSIQQNADLTLRFLYVGNVKVSGSESRSSDVFEIEVIPTSIVQIAG